MSDHDVLERDDTASKLTPDQIKFLDELAGSAGKAVAAAEKQAKQQALIGDVSAELDGCADGLRNAQAFTVIEKNEGVVGALYDLVGYQTTISSMDPGGDPNKEFETGNAVMGRCEPVDQSALRAVMEAQKKIVALEAKLRDTMEDGGTATAGPDKSPRPEDYKPAPMFAEDEIDAVIASEIWQPLVRGRVIPENAVPDRYSEAYQTFASASAEYQKRLAKYTASAPENDVAQRRKDMAETAFKAMNTVTTSVLDIVKDQMPGAEPAKILKEITDIQKLIADLGTVAFGAADAVLKWEFDPAIIASTLTAILSGIKLDTDPEHKAMVAQVKLGVSLALQSSVVIGYFAKGNPDKAVESIGKIIATSMATADSSGSKTWEDAGKTIDSAIKASVGFKNMGVKISERDYEGALKEACGAIQTVVTEQANQAIRKRVEEEDKQKRSGRTETPQQKKEGDDARDKEIAKQQKAYADVLTAAATEPQTIAALLANEGKVKDLMKVKTDPAALKQATDNWNALTAEQKASIIKMQRSQSDVELEEGDAEVKAAREDFAKLTKSKDPGDLDKLIATIKMQQARYTLAVKLASLPFAAIGAMFPPAKMGQSLLELANEMRLLVDCGQQYLSWSENVQDARRAGTVQAEAMTSRMDLSMTQSVRHGVEAALKVTQIIGQGMTIAGGPVAHIGLAIDKSASATMVVKQVVTAAVDERRAATAWRIYQKAFDNPSNRTAAREALRENATLAKYAIAYGAKKGNPIAANALRKCGITDDMMADKSAGVDKLVSFLEARFNEDPTILRRIPKGAWYPGDVALTPGSWMEFVTAAETDADPKLAPNTASAGVGARLTTLADLREYLYDEGDGLTLKNAGTLCDLLMATRRLLASMKPVDPKGEKHAEFSNYIEALTALIDADLARANDMTKILASDKATFEYLRKGFDPLRTEVLALTPAEGSALAGDLVKFKDLVQEVDDLAGGPDWAAAVVAVKAAKAAANKLLDDNLNFQKRFEDQATADAALHKQAEEATGAAKELPALQQELKALLLQVEQARKDSDWGGGLTALDESKKKAMEIIQAAQTI